MESGTSRWDDILLKYKSLEDWCESQIDRFSTTDGLWTEQEIAFFKRFYQDFPTLFSGRILQHPIHFANLFYDLAKHSRAGNRSDEDTAKADSVRKACVKEYKNSFEFINDELLLKSWGIQYEYDKDKKLFEFKPNPRRVLGFIPKMNLFDLIAVGLRRPKNNFRFGKKEFTDELGNPALHAYFENDPLKLIYNPIDICIHNKGNYVLGGAQDSADAFLHVIRVDATVEHRLEEHRATRLEAIVMECEIGRQHKIVDATKKVYLGDYKKEEVLLVEGVFGNVSDKKVVKDYDIFSSISKQNYFEYIYACLIDYAYHEKKSLLFNVNFDTKSHLEPLDFLGFLKNQKKRAIPNKTTHSARILGNFSEDDADARKAKQADDLTGIFENPEEVLENLYTDIRQSDTFCFSEGTTKPHPWNKREGKIRAIEIPFAEVEREYKTIFKKRINEELAVKKAADEADKAAALKKADPHHMLDNISPPRPQKRSFLRKLAKRVGIGIIGAGVLSAAAWFAHGVYERSREESLLSVRQYISSDEKGTSDVSLSSVGKVMYSPETIAEITDMKGNVKAKWKLSAPGDYTDFGEDCPAMLSDTCHLYVPDNPSADGLKIIASKAAVGPDDEQTYSLNVEVHAKDDALFKKASPDISLFHLMPYLKAILEAGQSSKLTDEDILMSHSYAAQTGSFISDIADHIMSKNGAISDSYSNYKSLLSVRKGGSKGTVRLVVSKSADGRIAAFNMDCNDNPLVNFMKVPAEYISAYDSYQRFSGEGSIYGQMHDYLGNDANMRFLQGLLPQDRAILLSQMPLSKMLDAANVLAESEKAFKAIPKDEFRKISAYRSLDRPLKNIYDSSYYLCWLMREDKKRRAPEEIRLVEWFDEFVARYRVSGLSLDQLEEKMNALSDDFLRSGFNSLQSEDRSFIIAPRTMR